MVEFAVDLSDPLNQRLLGKRLSWRMVGEYWTKKDIEDGLENPSNKPLTPERAESIATNMIERYGQERRGELYNRRKRGLRDNQSIWETRMDDTFEEALADAADEMQALDIRAQARFLVEATD